MNEPYWLRGAVVCTAVDEEECDGGRCCEYREVEDESEETTPADSDPGPVSETNAESGSLSESEADSAAVESDAGEEPDSDLPPFPPVESEAPPVGN